MSVPIEPGMAGPPVVAGPPVAGGGDRSEPRSRDGTRLRLTRLARGLSQQDLAAVAGVTRQAVAGIEAGRWDPSLRVALALARALNSPVEEVFGPPAALSPVDVRLLAASPDVGQRVELARVGALTVGLPLAGDRAWRAGFVAASGVVSSVDSGVVGGGTGVMGGGEGMDDAASVRPHVPAWHSVVVAGCDPALPLLAEPLSRLNPPVGLAWWPCSSQRALELAAAGLVHAAGIHFPEDYQGPVTAVGSHLGGAGAEVIGFAAWREGLAFPPNLNHERVTLVDVAQRGLRIVNREHGSEARSLLDLERRKAGLEGAELAGYDTQVGGHLLVASSVAAGLGDVGISTEPAALAYGLDFAALASERSYLVLARPVLTTPEAQALLRVLGSPYLQQQLSILPGYDASACGEVVYSC
ncbi:MAG: substrate-binding domain-containing protein [Acidimicrobiales bacterium]